MSEGGGGDSSMMMVVVLIVLVMSSCCSAAGAVGLVMYKNPNFLNELLGTISASTPGGAPPATDCNAKAQTDCTSVRGAARGPCIAKSKAACVSSGGSTAAGGCGDSMAELFNDKDYKGSSVKLKCGEYPNLSDYDMNDRISSMKIPSNLKVLAYNDKEYKGKGPGIFKNNIGYVGTPFGNEITSVKVVPATDPNPSAILGEWSGDTA